MTDCERRVAEAAEALRTAAKTRRPIAPVRELLGTSTDVDLAYRVQRANVDAALASGAVVSGRKIGVTSKAVQQQIGVDRPDFGTLFADTEYGDGADVPLDRFLQPRAEAEVAFVLGTDLLEPPFTFSRVLRSVAYVLPAIELVDSRIEKWDIGIVDTVADNASCGAYILGSRPRLLTDIDVRALPMTMTFAGAVVSTGSGAACLGNPLLAVQWLARTLADVGQPLRSGDVVLSGALGPLVSLGAEGKIVADLGVLGTVTATMVD